MYDIEGTLGFTKKPRSRQPEAKPEEPQETQQAQQTWKNGGIAGRDAAGPAQQPAPSPESNVNARDRAFSTEYANDPAYLNQQQQPPAAQGVRYPSAPPPRPPQVAEGTVPTRPREPSVFSNNPEYLKDLQKPQLTRYPNVPPPAPPQQQGNVSAVGPEQKNSASSNDNASIDFSVKGKFVSMYGRDNANPGLLFKPSGQDQDAPLYHFSPRQSQQMLAGSEELIKESIRNGSQGKDVLVSLNKAQGEEKNTWKVSEAPQQSGVRKPR